MGAQCASIALHCKRPMSQKMHAFQSIACADPNMIVPTACSAEGDLCMPASRKLSMRQVLACVSIVHHCFARIVICQCQKCMLLCITLSL